MADQDYYIQFMLLDVVFYKYSLYFTNKNKILKLIQNKKYNLNTVINKFNLICLRFPEITGLQNLMYLTRYGYSKNINEKVETSIRYLIVK